ncbi:MAG TPA: cupin domain-containing protein [Draconibacterium sp.]|nr:cupin domain-containing protein [Draconibacterium sp.]
MFIKNDHRSYEVLMPGVKMRPLVYEEKTILCEFNLERGSKLPAHKHPYEQTGYLLSGKLNFRIDKEWFIADPGDSWCVPENVEHQVEVIEDAHVLEMFAPLRTEYLPKGENES